MVWGFYGDSLTITTIWVNSPIIFQLVARLLPIFEWQYPEFFLVDLLWCRALVCDMFAWPFQTWTILEQHVDTHFLLRKCSFNQHIGPYKKIGIGKQLLVFVWDTASFQTDFRCEVLCIPRTSNLSIEAMNHDFRVGETSQNFSPYNRGPQQKS